MGGLEDRRSLLRRQGLPLEALQLYALFGETSTKLDLAHPDRVDAFVESVRNALQESLDKPSRLHGWRVQDLFINLVINLGQAPLIKTEDAGQIYTTESIKPPDFRIVLAKGETWLVEVKNFRPSNPKAAFTMSLRELESLERYCDLVGNPKPRLAIYWVPWNLWTITPTSLLARGTTRAKVALPDALKATEMIRLGDFVVGAKPPLTFRLTADRAKTTRQSETEFIFTVGKVEFRCGGDVIERPQEQNIAFWLMMFGSWVEEYRTETDSAGAPTEMVFEFSPVEWPEEQGFAMIGSMSSIFSGYYNSLTLKGDRVASLHEVLTPGRLGSLIPNDYKGKNLPLWRLRIQPN